MRRSLAYDATTGHSTELARSNNARLSPSTGPDVTRHIREWTARKRDASAKLVCAGLRTAFGCVLTGLSSTEQTARQYKTIPRVLAGSDVRMSAETRVPEAHCIGQDDCVLPLIERLQQSIQERATPKRALQTRGERSHLQQRFAAEGSR